MRSVALTLMLVMMMMMAGPTWAQSNGDSESVLAVHGSAEVRVTPDLAVVRLGIVEQAPTAQEAQQAVNNIANGIVEEIRAAGIDESDVQTARLTLSPLYSRSRNAAETPSIVAYRAMNTVSVRVRELDRIGEVIDAGLGAGANQLEGVTFQLQDDLSARQAALRAAVREAQQKAEAIAGALGVRIESILSVNEGAVAIARPMMEMSRALAAQEGSPTPVSPGEVSVSASVSVRYRIESD